MSGHQAGRASRHLGRICTRNFAVSQSRRSHHVSTPCTVPEVRIRTVPALASRVVRLPLSLPCPSSFLLPFFFTRTLSPFLSLCLPLYLPSPQGCLIPSSAATDRCVDAPLNSDSSIPRPPYGGAGAASIVSAHVARLFLPSQNSFRPLPEPRFHVLGRARDLHRMPFFFTCLHRDGMLSIVTFRRRHSGTSLPRVAEENDFKTLRLACRLDRTLPPSSLPSSPSRTSFSCSCAPLALD